MAQGRQVKDHVSSAILDATADVVSRIGDGASMSDVAEAAGISRATLYRYFPTREELLCALAEVAIGEVNALLVAADLDEVPVPEALSRAARAISSCGVKYAVVAQHRLHIDPNEVDRQVDEVDRQVSTPVRAVLKRGIDDGTLRDDLSVEVLFRLWGGLLMGALRSMDHFDNSVEQASAAVSDVFMHGARPPDTNT